MFGSRRSRLEALKRNAHEDSFAMSFTLEKKDYVIILDRIKNGNSIVQEPLVQARLAGLRNINLKAYSQLSRVSWNATVLLTTLVSKAH